ncbi:AP2-like ethylene-responsive transcription factor SNZ [Tetrabaena socialis]|uniref:AP2-like ethylene-responsive transcription factor SNZ n=1 Tax=Tetrabaena socialis TaxID=47790 RepID=A0A2J7ZUX6_9CHLO|nr:AP2-like ethylene-responsive transcription factor SNZ [Tetrabaena socialis]|eukprot:PNH04048.1 AP2-like ethylene-responsive transcription factor SNZ [Tetrabaena socialis]
MNQLPAVRPDSISFGNSGLRASSGPPLPGAFRGVCFDWKTGRWQAGIAVLGRSVSLGAFATEESAARQYDKCALRIRGFQALLNFPLGDYVEEADGSLVLDLRVMAAVPLLPAEVQAAASAVKAANAAAAAAAAAAGPIAGCSDDATLLSGGNTAAEGPADAETAVGPASERAGPGDSAAHPSSGGGGSSKRAAASLEGGGGGSEVGGAQAEGRAAKKRREGQPTGQGPLAAAASQPLPPPSAHPDLGASAGVAARVSAAGPGAAPSGDPVAALSDPAPAPACGPLSLGAAPGAPPHLGLGRRLFQAVAAQLPAAEDPSGGSPTPAGAAAGGGGSRRVQAAQAGGLADAGDGAAAPQPGASGERAESPSGSGEAVAAAVGGGVAAAAKSALEGGADAAEAGADASGGGPSGSGGAAAGGGGTAGDGLDGPPPPGWPLHSPQAQKVVSREFAAVTQLMGVGLQEARAMVQRRREPSPDARELPPDSSRPS